MAEKRILIGFVAILEKNLPVEVVLGTVVGEAGPGTVGPGEVAVLETGVVLNNKLLTQRL